MDVLFAVPYVPNPIRARSFNLIRHLGRRGHRVTVLTQWSNPQERDDLERLRAECHAVRAVAVPSWRSALNSLLAASTRQPLQSAYSWHPQLVSRRFLSGLAPDVIHVEHLRGARLALALREWQERRRRPAPVVWDSVDCISLLFRQAAARSRSLFGRWVTRFELGRTERYEGWLVGQFARVLVSSAADQRALAALAGEALGRSRITVVPNGVDVDYFVPGGEAREPALVVFSGKMSYHANITMALHLVKTIMPLVWAERAEARVVIVGKDPPREVQHLAADPRVAVTGTVPDLRAYLRRATVAAVPLVYGAGSQFKVLEAMACATPVVTTPQAAAPYAIRPEHHVLLGESPAAFAAGLLRVLGEPALARALGQAGRQFVARHHGWDSLAARLEEVYADLAHAQAAPAG